MGPVEGGAETVVAALRSAVGPTGTVMGYARRGTDHPEETLNGARLDDQSPPSRPPFDPATAAGLTVGSAC
ncbi:AAC(3) family N-acetyltransferase [Escherichia coli]|uniref:AAC(3) family N-acetyltransferase n=1 Tax=Escherichia coli TaxID=562 RepID=UPI00389019F5